MKIQKPLLAGKFDPDKAKFPYAATPKIDGIRFLMVEGQAVTRSFKPIRNEHIQQLLSSNLPDGIDGELTAGPTFQDCGSIMRIKGEPEVKVWIFMDDEAEIISFREKMINTNEATKDNFGRSKRSSSHEGLIPAGTLGGFILRRSDGVEFSCGSGLNDSIREKIWNNQAKYLGKLVKYKYMTTGVKDIPRHPVFIGFRDESDLS